MICKAQGCDNPIPPHTGRGRPKKTCSEECARDVDRRKAQQRMVKDRVRTVNARKDTVWSNLGKRAQWDLAIRRFAPVIGMAVEKFGDWDDLPPEMVGQTYRVVEQKHTRAGTDDSPGEAGNRLESKSALEGYAWEAIADLLYVHELDKLTAGMVFNRIKQHIIDQIRDQSGWGQPLVAQPGYQVNPTRVTAPDGTVSAVEGYTQAPRKRQVTGRLHLRIDPPRKGPGDPDDIVSDRVTAEVDRAGAIAELDGIDQLVASVYDLARKTARELAGLFGIAAGRDLEKLAIDGTHDDVLDSVRWFFREPLGGHGEWWLYTEAEVEAALGRAIEALGDPDLPDELYGAGEDRLEPDEQIIA